MPSPRPRRSATPPSAAGAITRLACAHAEKQGIDVTGLLHKAGLSRRQINDRSAWLDVQSQITFLDLVADALDDDLLGFHLSQNFELRSVGLLYYVIASSGLLGDALHRGARYSSIVNEGIKLTLREGKHFSFRFDYVGVSRPSDRHQVEFWIATLVRMSRKLTDRRLTPESVCFVHRRRPSAELNAFFGCEVRFGGDTDEAIFAPATRDLPIVSADSHLNALLIKFCEEALVERKGKRDSLALSVEKEIAVLLPHGKAQVGEVARNLGMSQRTLARRLAAEGVTFAAVLENLRSALARRHLLDPDLSVSKIAWLLGYKDVSAFTNAFKRWTGKTPRAVRQEAA